MKKMDRLFWIVFLGAVACSASAMRGRGSGPEIETDVNGRPLRIFKGYRYYNLDTESGQYVEEPIEMEECDDCCSCLSEEQQDCCFKFYIAGLFAGVAFFRYLINSAGRNHQD